MKTPVIVGVFVKYQNSVQTLPPHKDSDRRPQNYFHPYLGKISKLTNIFQMG